MDTKTSFLDKLNAMFWYCWSLILEAVANVLIFAAPGAILVGGVLFLYQGMLWLKHGTWKSITVLDALGDLLTAEFLYWIVAPTDWQGLSKLAAFVLSCSMWWVLMALGAILAVPLIALGLKINDAATISRPTVKAPPKKAASLEEMSGAELLKIVQGNRKDDD
ncbi:MAG: hypothetical protein KGJ82_11275 [Nitrospirota bacterium]|nr:hypothetical protein [Nitrospirota bacterium]